MMLLNHIAIIVSSEDGIDFYKQLGFDEQSREIRPVAHDELIYLSNGITVLEIYKDSTHPKRVTNPEALGLRHIGFQVENLEKFLDDVKMVAQIKEDKKGRFLFLNDPDLLPIEIREVKPSFPKE